MVVAQRHKIQVGQIAEFGGNGTCELIDLKIQFRQVGQVAELRRQGACQLILQKRYAHQAGHIAKRKRDGSRKLIGAQVQVLEVGERRQGGLDVACQVVVEEFQLLQVLQVPDFGGNCPCQVVAVQFYRNDPSVPIATHTMPGTDIARGGPPARVVRPVIAVGGVVQRHQSVVVGVLRQIFVYLPVTIIIHSVAKLRRAGVDRSVVVVAVAWGRVTVAVRVCAAAARAVGAKGGKITVEV